MEAAIQTVLCGRPLVFGDIEQIALINALQAKEREKSDREKKMAAGELVEFEVDLRVEGTLTVTVEASSKEEASKLASEDFDIWDLDVDEIDVQNCWAI